MIISNNYIKYQNQYHKIYNISIDRTLLPIYPSKLKFKLLSDYTEEDIIYINTHQNYTELKLKSAYTILCITFSNIVTTENEVVEDLI